MSVILVVETDASYAQRISEAMQSAGLPVEVCDNAESAIRRSAVRSPQLIVANSAVPEVRGLLGRFARAQGGPGAVVMIPTTLVGRVSAEDYHADAILPRPFTSDEVRQVLLPMLAPQETRQPQISSAELFGEVLAAVEGEAVPATSPVTPAVPQAAQVAPPTAQVAPPTAQVAPPTAQATQPTPPAAQPTPPVAPATSGAKPPRPRTASDEIDRKLEETLSGVLPLVEPRKRTPEGAQAQAKVKSKDSSDIDKLLDKTLSSLELPTRSRKRPGAPRSEPTRARQQSAAARQQASPPPNDASLKPSAFATTMLPAVEPEDVPATVPAATAPAAGATPTPLETMMPGEPPAAVAPESLLPTAEPVLPGPSLVLEGPPEPEEVPGALEMPEPDFLGAAEPPSVEIPSTPEGMLAPGTMPLGIETMPLEMEEPPDLDGAGPAAPEPFTPQPAAPEPPSFDDYRTQRLNIVPARDSAEGEVFGDYTLIRRIAIGGMAEVWQARRRGVEGFQKTVAIKKILSHLTGSADFVTMFIDEAKLAAQLNHNNIIQIYDLGKVGDDFFIAMEYVDGMDLRTILNTARAKRRPLPMPLSLMVASSVARALDYAHRKRDFDNRALGLVHRDVSPQNILIGSEGEIKLCDFGIVKAVAKASTTQMGALKGKLQYMSPEQAWGKPVDARSDIFSLGSVMFEMLTDTRLFAGDSEIGVLDAVRECRVRSVREITAEVPEEVDRVVRRALAENPEERYQTAGDLEEDLKGLIVSLKPMPSQSALATYMQDVAEAAEPEPEADAAAISSAPAPVPAGFQSSPAPAAEDDVTPAAPPPDLFAAKALPVPESTLPDAAIPLPTATAKQDAPKNKGIGPLVKILLAALLLGAIGTVVFLVLQSADRPREASPSATGAPSERPDIPAPVEAPAEAAQEGAPNEEALDGEPPDTEPEAGEGTVGGEEATAGALGEDEATATSEGTPEMGATQDLDLEDLVGQELARQKEELQKKLTEEFEAKKRKLEQELREAQDPEGEGKTSEGGGSGDR